VIARLRDPFVASMAVLGAVGVAGLVAVAVAWEAIADSPVVATQLPYAVSGGLGGLALLGFALALMTIQSSRRSEAKERSELERLAAASAALLAELRR
jgi:hypothetical protein